MLQNQCSRFLDHYDEGGREEERVLVVMAVEDEAVLSFKEFARTLKNVRHDSLTKAAEIGKIRFAIYTEYTAWALKRR